MKKLTLFFCLITSSFSYADYSKPLLLARLSDQDSWNVPVNTWCFTSEPAILDDKVYLGCSDEKGYLMGQWENGFKVLARAEDDQLFSRPVIAFGKAAWYEFSEISVRRSFELGSTLVTTDIKHLSSEAENTDSFFPLGDGSWFYRLKGNSNEIMVWKKNVVDHFFNPEAAYIYTPQVGPQGEIAFKTRDGDYNESSPDKIWLYNKDWKIILEDKDANPSSPWKSFRHQLSVFGNRVVAIATDDKGEALIEIKEGKTKILARAGSELASFDYFTPKLNQDTIVVRGTDTKGLKAVYVHDQEGFRILIKEGDIVQTDRGPGKVHYKNQDALFYGSPSIDEKGQIVLQATLTDPDYPSTLLGIGLIKFHK